MSGRQHFRHLLPRQQTGRRYQVRYIGVGGQGFLEGEDIVPEKRSPDASSMSKFCSLFNETTLCQSISMLPAPSMENVSSPRYSSVTEPVMRFPILTTTTSGSAANAVDATTRTARSAIVQTCGRIVVFVMH